MSVLQATIDASSAINLNVMSAFRDCMVSKGIESNEANSMAVMLDVNISVDVITDDKIQRIGHLFACRYCHVREEMLDRKFSVDNIQQWMSSISIEVLDDD